MDAQYASWWSHLGLNQGLPDYESDFEGAEVLILADLRGLWRCVCTLSIVWRANALQMIWVV